MSVSLKEVRKAAYETARTAPRNDKVDKAFTPDSYHLQSARSSQNKPNQTTPAKKETSLFSGFNSFFSTAKRELGKFSNDLTKTVDTMKQEVESSFKQFFK